MKFNYIYYILCIAPFAHLFFYQLKIFNSKDSKKCLTVFRSNNLLGFIIFLKILLIKNLIWKKQKFIKGFTEIILKNF